MAVADTSIQTEQRGLTLRHVSLVLTVIALLITGYLSYTKLTNTELLCVESSAISCDSVNSSAYAYFPRGSGIPVAYLGFASWVAIGALLLLETRVGFLRDYGVMLVFGLALFGFIFHSYLTYTSITFVGALCPWCLAALAIMTLLLIVTGVRLYRSLFAAQ